MSAITSRFLYAICQAGAERFLKEEIARDRRELRFAFSRPGFVTFKQIDDAFSGFPLDFSLHAVFARADGLQLGKVRLSDYPAGHDVRDWSKEAAALDEVAALAEKLRTELGQTPRLQAWDRKSQVPGEEPSGYDDALWSRGLIAALKMHRPTAYAQGDEAAQLGETVLTLIAVDPHELWLGAYRQGPGHSPYPGGDPKVPYPTEAPSRAYLKIEEAIRWSGAELKSGETAIEIGSAPGGASYALLQRGISVLGIDPGEMSPAVLRYRGEVRYQHAFARVEEMPDSEFEQPACQWLLLDMNMPPERALSAAKRVVFLQRASLRGLFLTVKLNQPEFAAQIPHYLAEVASWGMSRVRATQLASNKREFLIYAVPRRIHSVLPAAK